MKTLTETFNEIAALKQKKRIIAKLQENNTFVFRTILQGNFGSSIRFPFPEGEPPFKKNEKKIVVTDEIVKKLGACTVNAKGNPVVKERTFIQFLESINEADASLFCLMKDKKLTDKYPTITREIVAEAFPGLI